jgi:hypothetical protein
VPPSSDPYDDDPYDTHKDDCRCRHRRSAHTRTGCTRTVKVTAWSVLPLPQYKPGEEDHPFAWPTNWPPVNQLPQITKDCSCTGFHEPEPAEPDDY